MATPCRFTPPSINRTDRSGGPYDSVFLLSGILKVEMTTCLVLRVKEDGVPLFWPFLEVTLLVRRPLPHFLQTHKCSGQSVLHAGGGGV